MRKKTRVLKKVCTNGVDAMVNAYATLYCASLTLSAAHRAIKEMEAHLPSTMIKLAAERFDRRVAALKEASSSMFWDFI